MRAGGLLVFVLALALVDPADGKRGSKKKPKSKPKLRSQAEAEAKARAEARSARCIGALQTSFE